MQRRSLLMNILCGATKLQHAKFIAKLVPVLQYMHHYFRIPTLCMWPKNPSNLPKCPLRGFPFAVNIVNRERGAQNSTIDIQRLFFLNVNVLALHLDAYFRIHIFISTQGNCCVEKGGKCTVQCVLRTRM